MNIVTVYKSNREIHGNYKDLDTAINALRDSGFEVESRNEFGAIMVKPESVSPFAKFIDPQYRKDCIDPAQRVSIEPSRVSGI